jgi:protein SCO1/2
VSFAERLQKAVGKWPFWVALVGLIFALPIARALTGNPPRPPPVRGPIPEFRLVAQDGSPFGSDELRGKVWIANFVFTRCPTICPSFMERMADVRHRTRNVADEVHLVTFTVDPENDTPDRMAEYGRRFKASPRRWTLVTGPERDLRRVIVEAMKIAMGREPGGQGARNAPVDPATGIFHGTRFVLVDRSMRIRGWHEPTDEGVDALLRDVQLLVNENTRD